MTINKLALLAFIPLLAAGCVDRDRSTGVEHKAADPAAAATVAGAAAHPLQELLEYPANPEAFPLAPGSSVRGTLTTLDAGAILAVAFQIGNYANTSDGEVELELCEQKRCTTGKVELKGSMDNAYLLIRLQQPLPVKAAAELSYRFSKLGGKDPVALWLYQPNKASSAIKINDSDALERTPKIALQYGL